MEDIARQAGLSKGALYLYYKSKDAIIAALLNYFFAQEFKRLQALWNLTAMCRLLSNSCPRKTISLTSLLFWSILIMRVGSQS
jgi:AcrR family transcriptional regulator